jgi:hypothetical protein
VTNRSDLHDQIVLCLQQEFRGGFLLVDPLSVGTIGFWEHLADFIAGQDCARCHQLDMCMVELARRMRWLTRFRGGRRHG